MTCFHDIEALAPEVKMRRAVGRQRDLSKKRWDFAKAQMGKPSRSVRPGETAEEEQHWPVPQPAEARRPAKTQRQHSVKPHRMVRAAARQSLAKGVVTSSADMPSFSRGAGGKSYHAKPSISLLLPAVRDDSDYASHGASDFAWDEMADTTATEDEQGSDIHDSDSAGEEGDEVTPSSSTFEAENSREIPAEIHDVSAINSVHVEYKEQHQACKDGSNTVQEEVSPNPADLGASCCKSNPGKREEILRNLVEHLKQKESESSRRAEEASKRLAATEERKDGARKGKSSSLKLGLQLEKKQAAEAKRKRNQEMHLRAIREKAERAVEEAHALKEQAEAEALAAKAACLARAETESRSATEAYFSEELAKAKAQSEVLVQNGIEEVAKAEAAMRAEMEAAAAALKQEAVRKARALEVQAREALEQAEADTEKLKKRAAIEATLIKARAEMDAKEYVARAEAQQRARQQAEREARQRIEEEAEAAARAAKAEEQRQAAADLKLGKVLQQKQAKESRRRAEQEMQREREEAACRMRREKEKKLAEEEAEAIRAKAREEAQALEAKFMEEAEAAAKAVREQAEEDAREIRAKAQKQAQALQQSLCPAEAEQPGCEETTEGGSWEIIQECLGEEEQPQESDWSIICG